MERWDGGKGKREGRLGTVARASDQRPVESLDAEATADQPQGLGQPAPGRGRPVAAS